MFVNSISKEVYHAPAAMLSSGPGICTRKPDFHFKSLSSDSLLKIHHKE